MESDSLPSELILNESCQSLGKTHLAGNPQPGTRINFEGKTYTVLERRHHYQLKANQYRLHKIALYVQKTSDLEELHNINNRWVIGDITCLYNAHSELIRCAIHPEGPCQGCSHYQPR